MYYTKEDLESLVQTLEAVINNRHYETLGSALLVSNVYNLYDEDIEHLQKWLGYFTLTLNAINGDIK